MTGKWSQQWNLGAGDGFWAGYDAGPLSRLTVLDHMPDTDDADYLDGYYEGFLYGQEVAWREVKRNAVTAVADTYGITWFVRQVDRIVGRFRREETTT